MAIFSPVILLIALLCSLASGGAEHTVFNTCTREYEEVAVTEEVYRTYYRTGWNIKDNNQRFFDNEIQMSGMIGSQDGAYENFREFVDTINTPENIALEQMMIQWFAQLVPIHEKLSEKRCFQEMFTAATAVVAFLRLPQEKPITHQSIRSASQFISAIIELNTRNSAMVPLHIAQKRWMVSWNPFFGVFLRGPNE